jgi:antitoxin HicB
VAAKVLLLSELINQGKRPAELARLMHARPQEVTRFDAIAAALLSQGKRLELRIA